MLSLASLKTYLSYHFQAADEGIKVKLEEFVNYVEGEEAKEKAAVALLVAKKYTVTPPTEAAPAPLAAPAAA